jgi:hypothetical protein
MVREGAIWRGSGDIPFRTVAMFPNTLSRFTSIQTHRYMSFAAYPAHLEICRNTPIFRGIRHTSSCNLTLCLWFYVRTSFLYRLHARGWTIVISPGHVSLLGQTLKQNYKTPIPPLRPKSRVSLPIRCRRVLSYLPPHQDKQTGRQVRVHDHERWCSDSSLSHRHRLRGRFEQ